MNDQYGDFRRRVTRINRDYGRRGPGFVIRPDGLAVPKTRSRLRFYFPFRALIAGFVTIVFVKGFMIYYLGVEGYESRLATLIEGSAYQELAARLLAPDPVSSWTAARIADLVALLPFA